ncbi:class I SAM-dependent methyltransferase [Nocardia mangyaensis]|uniref:class I SAM-dependent methyltransferase n=1 Tax=Nocardia mangyaensis TaxID=2213200 RepID=UPI002674C1E1|nr:class I SAM-dependent methyltransferase [Nocardia mangyaensis]MDO3650243.1 methyltransferase domain-containing protein [Nocardia mangyaensis]
MSDDTRFDWLADLMGVRPGDQVLELGPGPGASLGRVAARLSTGRVVGLDRSAAALTRARARCPDELATGKVRLVEGAIGSIRPDRLLGELDRGADGFDLIFAVNVNVFWTKPAHAEWNLIRDCLSPTGRVWLCYGYGGPTAPSTSPKPTPAELAHQLTNAGFRPILSAAGDLIAARVA